MNKKYWMSLVLLVFFIFSGVCAKIRLFTFQYNRPDFIEMQYKCLKKFLKEKDDFELIVFSDATDEQYKKQIEEMCQRYSLMCITFPQELHCNNKNGSVRHCNLVRYALDNFGYNHDDIIGLLEGDVFLIRDFSIRELLQNYDIASAMQTDRKKMGLEYIWIGLAFLNMKMLPNARTINFDYTYINNVLLDSGGSTYYYLQQNPQLKIKKYYRNPISLLPRSDAQQLARLGFSDHEIRFLNGSLDCVLKETSFLSVEFHMDNHFLHYSWSRCSDGLDCKAKLFQDFFNDILA